MHVFQPLPLDLIEINPFQKLSKEWAIVTAGTKVEANPMTVSWGGFGTFWGKSVLTIYVRESRFTKEFIDKSDFFSVSFLPDDKRNALSVCGSLSGKDNNKWEQSGLTLNSRLGIPFPDESSLVYLCKKIAAVPITAETFMDKEIDKKFYAEGDYHTMYIGEIIDAMAR
ncbi:flavin reductase family protein [Lachnospira pectinoschiza]|uniref:Flavin reductase like domain-containing protein n=1 Tax=Lachnospira pectinoschiza TaxID=28052 RepID=A0A1G9VPE8_9FIRM|nr:flavin reductase [Lachnospira pectinoschiza]SDM74049.1 Flavin reductase like domain-containing protein [Lachnospira pectinoschiza]